MTKGKIILALLLASFRLQAQTIVNSSSLNTINEAIDRYLTSAVAAYKFNGVALVAQEEEIIFHKANGWKNVSDKTQNDTGTKFPILSITKSFTAIIILKLQEQNKLSVKDKLSSYLPDFPNGNKISIEHLITHTSGIYNFTDDIGEEDLVSIGIAVFVPGSLNAAILVIPIVLFGVNELLTAFPKLSKPEISSSIEKIVIE